MRPIRVMRRAGILAITCGFVLAGSPAALSPALASANRVTTSTPGPGGELINAHAGKCLAVPNNSTVNGTALKLEDCYGAAGEIWALS